jgi:predicted ribosome quality control (RQC) complex YloA/Tae2 family protein
VGELCGELARVLAGARVRDVVPLPPRDVVLAVTLPGGDPERAPARLRLASDPEAPRIHLVGERMRAHKGSVGPFFRALAEQLPGRTLRALEQVDGDRIVRLVLERDDGDAVALVLELAGRHANLALLDAADRVVDVLVPPPPSKDAGDARLAVGDPWRPPPGRAPSEPGPSLPEAFPLPEQDERDLGATPLSRRVELTLGVQARELRHARLAKELLDRLKRRRKTLERTLAGLADRRAAGAEAERVRQDGELLKAALGRVKRGMTSVELEDWFAPGAPLRRVALEARLAPQENAARFFQRAKKLARDAESVADDAARAEEALARVAELEEAAAAPDCDPEELDDRAVAEGLLAPRQDADSARRRTAAAKPEPRRPYRRFVTDRGTEVLVGRSARDNDELSLKVGRGNDAWLHTADAPGSHVVLRCAKGAEPDPEDVLDAAHLAVHFSPLRGARKADVHVARCKDVKKPKGFKPGLVSLSGGRTLHLAVEEERLARLLDARRGPAAGRRPGTG